MISVDACAVGVECVMRHLHGVWLASVVLVMRRVLVQFVTRGVEGVKCVMCVERVMRIVRGVCVV